MKSKTFQLTIVVIVVMVVVSLVLGATVSGLAWYPWGGGRRETTPTTASNLLTIGQVFNYFNKNCIFRQTELNQDCNSVCGSFEERTCIFSEVLNSEGKQIDSTGLSNACSTKNPNNKYNCMCCKG